MRTLDQFFEIGFSTYYDITSLRLSLHHVSKKLTMVDALQWEQIILVKVSCEVQHPSTS